MSEQPTPTCPYCGAVGTKSHTVAGRVNYRCGTYSDKGVIQWRDSYCTYAALKRIADDLAKACIAARPYVADSCRAPVDNDDSNYGDRRALRAIDASVAAHSKLRGAKP